MEAISKEFNDREGQTDRQTDRQRNKEGMGIMRCIQVFIFGTQKHGNIKNMGYTPHRI